MNKIQQECDGNATRMPKPSQHLGTESHGNEGGGDCFCVRNACTARIKEMKVEIPKNRKNSVKEFSKEFSKANHRVCV